MNILGATIIVILLVMTASLISYAGFLVSREQRREEYCLSASEHIQKTPYCYGITNWNKECSK